jgi:Flp pilus assembly pilin Flp
MGRALRGFHRDERGAEGLEKILILAAVALPLLGLLIFFRDELGNWLKNIWGTEKTRGEQKLYEDGAYGSQ